jgi:ribosomal protein L31
MQAAAKKDLHPVLHTAKIICNGEDVGEITGTKEEYVVDVWAGNHPFYRGDGRSLVIDEGQVSHSFAPRLQDGLLCHCAFHLCPCYPTVAAAQAMWSSKVIGNLFGVELPPVTSDCCLCWGLSA